MSERVRRVPLLLRVAVLGALTLPGVVVVAPAAAAQTTAVCVAAQALLDDHLPRRALATIEAAQAAPEGQDACAEQEEEARTALQTAAGLTQTAARHLEAEEWVEAQEAATAALALDQEDALAEQQAKAAKARTSEARNPVQQLRDDWDDFAESYLAPAASLAVPVAAVLLVLLGLARIGVLVVRRWPPSERADDDGQFRRTLIGTSAVAMVTGALCLTIALSDAATPPMVSAFGVLAGLVVLGLGLGFVEVGHRRPGESSGLGAEQDQAAPAWDWWFFEFLGVGVVISGIAVAVVPLIPWNVPDPVGTLGLAALGTAISVGGVVGGSWWLATQLRLQVSVTGSDDTEHAAEVGALVALLNAMGAEAPRGMEVPRGTDVTALKDAMSVLPDNAVLKALQGFVSGLTGVTPWTVRIEGGTGTRSVAISRNGRGVNAVLLDATTIPAPAAPAATAATEGSPTDTFAGDSLALAAAVVLTTLAREHPSVATGLAGATQWRSVGLQHLASDLLGDPAARSRRRLLLAEAVNDDAGNRMARLALQHEDFRESGDGDELRAYADWLDDFAGDPVLTPAMRLRVRYTRAIVVINATFAASGPPPPPTPQERVVAALSSFCQELRSAGGDEGIGPPCSELPGGGAATSLDVAAPLPRAADGSRDLDGLVAQMRATWSSMAYVVSAGTDRPPPEPRTPRAMYSLGCSLASRHDVPWREEVDAAQRDADDARAAALFERASAIPAYARFLRTDPQLSEFRTRPAYRRAFLASPRDSFLLLKAVEPFAERLRDLGLVGEPAVVAADPVELALYLGTTQLVARRVVEIAHLCLSLRSLTLPEGQRPLDRYAVEIMDELGERRLDSWLTLTDLSWAEVTALATSVRDAIIGRFTPDGEDLDSHDAEIAVALDLWLTLLPFLPPPG